MRDVMETFNGAEAIDSDVARACEVERRQHIGGINVVGDRACQVPGSRAGLLHKDVRFRTPIASLHVRTL